MRGNPTTGYMWEASEEKANGAFEIERTYIMDTVQGEDTEFWAGIGGTYYFTLSATSNGAADGNFHIRYGRSYQSDEEALDFIHPYSCHLTMTRG